MTINIGKQAEGFIMPVSFDLVCDVPPEYNLRDSQVTVKACGTVKGSPGSGGFNTYNLEAQISTVLYAACCKCLDDCEYLLDVSIKEGFSDDPKAEEKELWPVRDESIDLAPAVAADFFLNIPMRILCKEDCKGLCRVCGHNLNDGDCGCDRTFIDPRFEALQGMFNDKFNNEESTEKSEEV